MGSQRLTNYCLLLCLPLMRSMAEEASPSRSMDRLVLSRQDLLGMAAKTIGLDRLDSCMGLVALVTVQTRHGRTLRERGLGG